MDQLLGGFHAAPQHPEQRQVLQKARCDASQGQHAGADEKRRRHDQMGQAGDQGAAEFALDPGFAANGGNEETRLDEHGTALQIAQPGGGFKISVFFEISKKY